MEPSTPEPTIVNPVPEAPPSKVAQFFIPAAASLQERRPRNLKHGDTFAVFDHNGDALAGPGSPEGIYHRDTRHLSHLYLTISGARPMLLSSTLREDNSTLTCDLTNPDVYNSDGNLEIEHDVIHIRRSRFLWNATCHERIAIRNFDEERRRISVNLAFAADFFDLFEVRGSRRARRGTADAPRVERDRVTLAYTGLDRRRRETSLRFEPVPSHLTGHAAQFECELPPHAATVLYVEISCAGGDDMRPPRHAFLSSMRDARRALRQSASRAASISTSNDILNEAIRRSVSDLYMLLTDTPEGPYPYAGIPWFSTVFGRDALITALQTLWLDPMIARGVLLHLAKNQAIEEDPEADAEPGKILHEVRYGEMAELGEVPFRRYYGSVDSTPLFIILAGAYAERTGDHDTVRRIWTNIEAALEWIDKYGDPGQIGFVTYGRRNTEGLINQGWKDSHDSIFHADGTMAKGPIALCEVQAYVYGAWRAAAEMARRLGRDVLARELDQRASDLRMRFDEAFWDGSLGTYVIALDGAGRPCRVRASNAGHVLMTGLALPERAVSVVEVLMARNSFSGWGIRTVPTSEARYNPMSYHNGSVWPHDNALIGAGFARYGFREEAARLFEGLFAAAMHVDLRRLPELFCGFPRQRGKGPTFYPVACAPQAWAAGALLSLLQSCLGIRFEPDRGHVVFEHPLLPKFIDEVTLRGLTVEGGHIDVALTRSGREVALHVLHRHGDIRVTTSH